MPRFAFLFATIALISTTASAQYDPSISANPGSIDYAMLKRPLTLSKGALEADIRLSRVHLQFDLFDETISASATAMMVGAAYGITDRLEIGATTTLLIDPDIDWGEVLGVRGGFLVLDTDQLAVASTIWVPVNLGDGDAFRFIGLGADTRLALTDRFALLFGHNLLTLGIGDFGFTLLNLNIAASIQLIDMLAVRLDTSLASIAITGQTSGTTTIADAQHIGLSAILSPIDMLDIFVGLTIPDVGDAVSLYFLTFGATVRLGS